MASLGTLTLDLVAKTSGFVQGMDKAERASKKWRRQVERDIERTSKRFGKGLAIGATAAAAGLTLVVNRSRNVIDEQAKMAQRLRATTETTAILTRATDRAGLSMRVLETAARTLEINLGRASQGYKAQSEAVQRLGLDVESLIEMPLDERILKLSTEALLRNNIPASLSKHGQWRADLFGSQGRVLRSIQLAQTRKRSRIVGGGGRGSSALALSDVRCRPG